MGFSTGSVVVPATSETIDTAWRVIALSSEDLPTFRRPNNPMCRRSPFGVFFMAGPRAEAKKAGVAREASRAASPIRG